MSLTIVESTSPGINEVEWRARWCAEAGRSFMSPRSMATEDDRTLPEPIQPQRFKLASAGIRHLSAIIREIVDLWEMNERDEFGSLRPSKYAFDEACRLLVDAAIVAMRGGREVPYGCASTDAEGGIRIEWVRPQSSVHLVVPAAREGESYIYHEVGECYATEPATPEALAHWLRNIAGQSILSGHA